MQPGGSSSWEKWNKPLCLVDNVKGSEMKINEETLAHLRCIKDPMVVVSIVGLYRTGKSYLMNCLAGKQSGFDLGNTVQAKTKGIWIWCVPHATKPNTCLALLDTEGLGDVEKGDNQNDVMLFTLAALLSSCLIYNSKGTIDQTAMDSIHFVTEIAERIKLSDKGDISDEDDTRIAEHFPTFVWTLRDFVLQLEIDGNAVTSDGYLEKALEMKPGASKKVTSYNLPRKCIRRYFPSRRCFVFPLPVSDSKLMSQLDGLPTSQLLPAFLERSKEFSKFIYDSVDVKCVGGTGFNGTGFAEMARHYVEEINSGKTPSIEGALVATARRVNDDVLCACVKEYRKSMDSLPLPVDEKELEERHEKFESTTRSSFLKSAMIVGDETQVKKMFTDRIEKEFQEVLRRNDELREQKCTDIFKKLNQEVVRGIDSGTYFVSGGYATYQHDFASVVKEYLSQSGGGAKSLQILEKFVSEQSAAARSIMHCDKRMSEADRQREEQRLKDEEIKEKMANLQRANEAAARRLEQQARLQEQFMNSMQAKLNSQAETYRRQISQLQRQLEQERSRLKEEKAHEEEEEVAEAMRRLQLQRQQTSPWRHFVFRM